MGRMKRGVGAVSEPVKRAMFQRLLALADDLDLLLPECDCGRFFCPWDSTRKKLEGVLRYRKDATTLKAVAKSGRPVPRAFAASLSFAVEGEVEGMAPLPLGGHTYYWAPMGTTPQKALIGVQNYHEPGLRLLALSLVPGRSRYTVFATKEKAVAVSAGSPPPESFIASLGSGIRYSLKRSGNTWECGHCGDTPHLSVGLSNGGFTLKVCARCARDESNLAVHASASVLAPPRAKPFQYEFHPALRCIRKTCSLPSSWDIDPEKLEEYTSGKLSDRAVLKGEATRMSEQVQAHKLLTAGGHCYEDDPDALVEALQGTPEEKVALQAVAAKLGSVQLAEATTSRLLEIAWGKQAAAALTAVSDGETAVRILREMPNASPQQMIAAAAEAKRADQVLADLPQFANLPPLAGWIDRAARAHRVGGVDAAVRVLEGGMKDHRAKSVRYAFLVTLGRLKGEEWQFTREEADLGRFLGESVGTLLASTPETYHEALQGLLTLSGSGESLPPTT